MNRNSEIKAKYDAKATRRYGLKLNLKTDKEVIEKLDTVDSMQGYIKQLIREDIGMSLFVKVLARKDSEGYRITECGIDEGCRKALLVNEKDPGDRIRIYESKDPDAVVMEKDGETVETWSL